MNLAEKRAAVLEGLKAAVPTGRLAVAFSGGVDSTLLLALAVEGLGSERVQAFTAHSASLAAEELEGCRELAAEIGAPLRLLNTRELEREDYRRNDGNRCFHCKDELFVRIAEVAREEGVAAVAYGATADDVGDHRPGMQAADEHGVLAPLLDAGLGKAEIRALSQDMGLRTWDKPAQPCLASRVPYGQEVTASKLARIDRAEATLRRLGFRELRVRHQGDDAHPTARIELPVAELGRMVQEGVRQAVVTELRAHGFAYVALDLEGFRSGRLNEVLNEERKLPVVASE